MKSAFMVFVAVVIGVLGSLALLIAVEFYSSIVHPFPPGFDNSQVQLCQHVENYPAWVLMSVIPMWSAIGFASPWLAGRIGNIVSAGMTAVLLGIAIIGNLIMLPYPLWFQLGCGLPFLLAIGMALWVTWKQRQRKSVRFADLSQRH